MKKEHSERFVALTVDFVTWLEKSFTPSDYVVLKMDIEGAERTIVERMLTTNVMRLVDVFLWECHLGDAWCEQAERCMHAAGIGAVYREPYTWAAAPNLKWVPPA